MLGWGLPYSSPLHRTSYSLTTTTFTTQPQPPRLQHGPKQEQKLVVATGANPNNSRSEGIHTLEIHGQTFTGCFTLVALFVTAIILWQCYTKKCFRCFNRIFYRREAPQRGTHIHTIATRDDPRKDQQPVIRSLTGPDHPVHSADEGYYP